MPWIAFVPDISGVCSIVGTFEITSKPTNTASTKIVISVIRSPLMRSPAALDRFATRSLTIRPSCVIAAPAMISSSKSRFSVALGREVREQVRDVVRVQQAGVERHLARQVERAVDRDAVAARSPGPARSARSCRRSRPRCRRSPSRAASRAPSPRVTSFGAGRPGTAAVVITQSAAATRSASSSRWRRCDVLGQLLRVLARSRRPRPPACTSICDELGAQALDLLLHRGPHVVGLDDGAEPLRGRDRLQARRRRRRAPAPATGAAVPAAVISIGKNLPSSVRAGERRAVAGHHRLRGQRVHRLRAGRARDRLHREARDARARPAASPGPGW